MLHDVKVDLRLLVAMSLHVKWVVEFYHNMQLSAGKKIVENGFRKGHAKEAYDQAIVLQNCTENPFSKVDIEVLWFS